MTDPRTDRELLVASRVETAAFEELYRRHVGATIRFAARRAERPSDVVDLVAAVWLEVVASLDRYEPHRGDALPWILGIAANMCAVERRRRAREHEVVRRLGGRRSLDDDDFERLEGAIDAHSVASALRQGLRELPPSERAIAELVFLDGLTPVEAADARHPWRGRADATREGPEEAAGGRRAERSSREVRERGDVVMTKVDEREPMTFEQNVLDLALESLSVRQRSDLLARAPRPPRRRRVVIAIAAGGIAIAIAMPIALPGGRTGGADPAAAGMLHRVALRAAQQPPEPAPLPGQYLYTRSESASTFLYVVGDGRTLFFHQPFIRESWIGPDGSGRILNTAGAVTFPTDEDRATWIAAGSPDLCADVCEGLTDSELFGPGELIYSNYADLPTDPEELLELIESRELIGGPDGDWETFVIIGDLLRETSTPPQVRAALYQVAADLPSVELVGRVVDGAGRPGMAVAYRHERSDAPSRQELIFDPTTPELLGSNEVLIADSTVDVESGGPGAIYGGVGPAGLRTGSTTYLVSGVVDSTNESL